MCLWGGERVKASHHHAQVYVAVSAKTQVVELGTGRGQEPVIRGVTWPHETLASLSPRKFLSIRVGPADRQWTELSWIIFSMNDKGDRLGPRASTLLTH